MPEVSPLIRLFVSSTFSDFNFEREVLQRAVFPRLRTLCAAQGCRFQPIDLRWGVSEEAGNEKRTLAICLDEIARCQRLSPDLNFLILLGDRYGSCFLPERIPSDQVARLLPHLAPAECDAFAQAYKEDLNALRPEYVLLPNKVAGDARQSEDPLRAALAQAAQAAGFTEQELLPFVASATHLEIQRGLLDVGGDPSAALCAIRSFESMPEESQAAQYVEQDTRRRAQLEALRAAVEQRLDGRVLRYDAPGQIVGPPMGHAARALYKTLFEQFYKLLEPRIQDALALRQVAARTRDFGAEANRQFASSRASVVVGRDDALDTVATYLAGQTPLPLVVTGDSGIGKSTLLARAVEDAGRTHPNAVIVTRYIGVTPGTSSLVDLLSGLRREIAERFGRPTPEPLGELYQLVTAFAEQLGILEATTEQPLFLVVDALDQLSANPQRVDWLPRTLAPHVHVVLSTLSDRQELESLRVRLPETQILRLDPLTRAQGADVLRNWLSTESRRLTSEQVVAVLDGFAPEPERCGAPLYLRLAYEQARTWRSFDHVNPLPPTTTALVQTYFSELEDSGRHGRELVAYALGDLAAAKHGLAEDELLDVLSRSAAVRQALHRLSPGSPPIKARHPLPVALWVRLHADLERYLTERETDGTRLITFYHRQVQEEAVRRYLSGGERAPRHADLAAYFGRQSYHLSDSNAGQWNRRKLAELASQQSVSGPQAHEALTTTLTDGRFLEGKLTVEGVGATLDDLALAPEDKDIAKVATAVRAGALVLSTAPLEWLNQIVGRGVHGRLHDIPERQSSWFRLRSASLIDAGDPALLGVLQGHTHGVTGCVLSQDGKLALSASKDHTLRLWNTTDGECRHILNGPTAEVRGCALSADGRLAAAIARYQYSDVLWLWNTMTGRLEHSYKFRNNQVLFALSGDGRVALLVINPRMKSTLTQVDTTTGQTIRTFHVKYNKFPIDEHETTACALNADGGLALVGFDNGTMRVWDTTRGQILHTLKGHTRGITACVFSADGRLALSASHDRTVRLWDVNRGQLVRVLVGHSGSVTGCSISADGALILSSSTDSTARLWDAGNGGLIDILSGHTAGLTSCALSADGHIALSGSEDRTVRLWDTNRSQAQPLPSGNSVTPGRVTSCALSADGRVALTASPGQTAPCLWDTTSGQITRSLEGHGRGVFDCALSADGKTALTASADRTLRLWDTASGHTLRTLKRRRDLGSSDNKLQRLPIVAIGVIRAWRNTFHDSAPLWGMESMASARQGPFDSVPELLPGHSVKDIPQVLPQIFGALGESGYALGCALSGNGKLALSAHSDGTLRLWDTKHGRRMLKIRRQAVSPNGCSLSASGELAFTLSSDGGALDDPRELFIWKTSSRHGQTYTLEKAYATACTLSADGSRALASCSDGTLRFWENTRNQRVHVLVGHAGRVNGCALSADGRLALSASSDRTLRLCDTATMREVARWTHDCDLESCALSADGRLAVAGDSMGGIHFLDVLRIAETEQAPSTYSPTNRLAEKSS